MKLPHADAAVVDREKVVDYLLNPQHRFGASKAQFFSIFGYFLERWEVLAEAFRAHGRQHHVGRVVETEFGARYQVDGELQTPSGRSPRIRTVGQWDKGQLAPRLITAYPLES